MPCLWFQVLFGSVWWIQIWSNWSLILWQGYCKGDVFSIGKCAPCYLDNTNSDRRPLLRPSWEPGTNSTHCCDANLWEADVGGSWAQAQPGPHIETLPQQKQRQKSLLWRETFPHQVICHPWCMVYIDRTVSLYVTFWRVVRPLLTSSIGFLVSSWACGTEHIWCVSVHSVLVGALTAPPSHDQRG